MSAQIIGKMGYAGSGLLWQLWNSFLSAELSGFEIGFYTNRTIRVDHFPETRLIGQVFMNVADFAAIVFSDKYLELIAVVSIALICLCVVIAFWFGIRKQKVYIWNSAIGVTWKRSWLMSSGSSFPFTRWMQNGCSR